MRIDSAPARSCRGARARVRAVLLILLLAAAAAPGRAEEVDWAEVEREAVELLQSLIRIDTSNPPGDEVHAARFLQKRFHEAGIEAQLYESEPGRGSVLARVEGSGGARPLILLNHLDVVGANAEEWSVPPFSGDLRDGYVYGRGALDCKGMATAQAAVMLLLKRQQIGLRRDIVFLGTAGEETGGQEGAGWITSQRFDPIRNAEFVLNEGGHIEVLENGRRLYEVAVVEKTPCWLRLKATGAAGHGSTPPEETAVTRLVRALHRIVDYDPPTRVTPEVAAYYAALAQTETGALRERYRDIRSALADPAFRNEFLQDPRAAARVRNTLTPTVFTASQKTNVIPRTATADLDCRLLPDEDANGFVRTVAKIVDDPNIEIEVLLNFPPSSSPTDTALYRAIQTVAREDRAPVIPTMLTGFTDSHYFREKGVVSYGFMPFELGHEERRRMHGIDERMSAAELRRGIERLLRLLQALDAEDARQGGGSNAR